MSRLRIAVVFGGVSSEHEVSLVSATSVIQNIPQDKYEVVCIGITQKGRWLYYPGDVSLIATGEWEKDSDCVTCMIPEDRSVHGILKLMPDYTYSVLKIDAVFPVLHGKNGEDGTIQGLLALSGIPYVGCDTISSANCMDKTFTHTILDHAGIRTAGWRAVYKYQLPELAALVEECEQALGYPMFVKPANAGSSVGVNKAGTREELVHAIKIAFAHDDKAVIEEMIHGREVECAVLGNEQAVASVPGEIEPSSEFYDYEDKYVNGTSRLYIPARISAEAAEQVRRMALAAYRTLGCSGLARVDFFVCGDGAVVLNEINTLPGFTDISMYPKLLAADGISYPELIDRLITLAIERADEGDE